MNADEVYPGIVVGSYPESVGDIDRLQSEFGVTAVLNMHTDEDLSRLRIGWSVLEAYYLDSKIEICRIPVLDFDNADLCRHLPECVTKLRELLDAGHTVYVHCTAGMSRSPSAVIAYLHWVQEIPFEAAYEQVQSHRFCSPDVKAIRKAGQAWSGRQKDNAS